MIMLYVLQSLPFGNRPLPQRERLYIAIRSFLVIREQHLLLQSYFVYIEAGQFPLQVHVVQFVAYLKAVGITVLVGNEVTFRLGVIERDIFKTLVFKFVVGKVLQRISALWGVAEHIGSDKAVVNEIALVQGTGGFLQRIGEIADIHADIAVAKEVDVRRHRIFIAFQHLAHGRRGKAAAYVLHQVTDKPVEQVCIADAVVHDTVFLHNGIKITFQQFLPYSLIHLRQHDFGEAACGQHLVHDAKYLRHPAVTIQQGGKALCPKYFGQGKRAYFVLEVTAGEQGGKAVLKKLGVGTRYIDFLKYSTVIRAFDEDFPVRDMLHLV